MRIAQQVGLSLDEIRTALASLPDTGTPTCADWERLSASWRPQLDARIALLERLRDTCPAASGAAACRCRCARCTTRTTCWPRRDRAAHILLGDVTGPGGASPARRG